MFTMNESEDYHRRKTRTLIILFLLGVLLLIGAVMTANARVTGYESRNAVSLPQASAAVPPCSSNWTLIPGVDIGESSTLLDVSALATNDAWAIGEYYTSTITGTVRLLLGEHWNGSEWTQVNVPSQLSYSSLIAVDMVSTDDVWIVGAQDDSANQYSLIMHWNGSEWTPIASPNPGTCCRMLVDVEAVSSDDVWAVGHYQSGNELRTLFAHWNGAYWEQVASPNPGSGNQLSKLTVISADDIWAVGDYNIQEPQQILPLALHWDGNAWTQVLGLPDLGDYFLTAVDAVSTNDIWASAQTSGGVVMLHWDGNAWTQVSLPNPDVSITDIVAIATNDIWAVGGTPTSNGSTTLIVHWNGNMWTQVPSPSPGTQAGLSGVAAVSARDVWAVGQYDDGWETPIHAIAERYYPCDATPTPNVTATSTSTSTATSTTTSTTTSTSIPTTITTSTPSSTPTTCSIQFSDVLEGSTFYPFIMRLACAGVISGYADGTFRPGNEITRGQIAKVVSNAASFQDDVSGRWTYSDVASTSPFWLWIERLSMHGVMGGYTCGGEGEPCDEQQRPYFRPGNNATRGQLSKIVSNAAGYNEPAEGQMFTDIPPTHPFYEWIQRLATRGVMGGYACGGEGEPCDEQQRPYFRPANNVTRGQASKIVANTFFPEYSLPTGSR